MIRGPGQSITELVCTKYNTDPDGMPLSANSAMGGSGHGHTDLVGDIQGLKSNLRHIAADIASAEALLAGLKAQQTRLEQTLHHKVNAPLDDGADVTLRLPDELVVQLLVSGGGWVGGWVAGCW